VVVVVVVTSLNVSLPGSGTQAQALLVHPLASLLRFPKAMYASACHTLLVYATLSR